MTHDCKEPHMGQVMTIEEIKEQFDSEWILLEDTQVD
jgi:hypothetical protein